MTYALDQLHPAAREAIADFKATAWGLVSTEPRLAAGMCERASLVLFHHLEMHSQSAELYRLSLYAPEDGQPDGAPRSHHYVVGVTIDEDEVFIDVTARQFDSAAETVVIYTRHEIETMWGRIVREPAYEGYGPIITKANPGAFRPKDRASLAACAPPGYAVWTSKTVWPNDGSKRPEWAEQIDT